MIRKKKEMNDIYILKEIAKWDESVWELFSLLNKEMNEYFNIRNREYEMCFRKIETKDRTIYYKLDGNYHRSDGPAITYNNSSESWYFNGKLHRLDGPAMIRKNYCNIWYKNGKLHRIDGPAIEHYKDDMKKYNQWFINGKRILKENEKDNDRE